MTSFPEPKLIAGHYEWCHLSTVTMEEAANLGWDTACDCWLHQRTEQRILEAAGVGLASMDDELEPVTTVKVLKHFSETLSLLWIMPTWAWQWGFQVRDVLVVEFKPEGDIEPELRLIKQSNTRTEWEFNLGPLCLRRRPLIEHETPSDMQRSTRNRTMLPEDFQSDSM